MTTHFITAEIDLQVTPLKLKQKVESELAKEGKPLRWAITKIDKEKETATVEAVVTQD